MNLILLRTLLPSFCLFVYCVQPTRSLEVNLLEAFQVDSQITGVYHRELELGFTEFRFTEAIPRILAPNNVVQEVAALLQKYDEFMIVVNLKMERKRPRLGTVFSLEDRTSGKAILAFWTDAKRRKVGLKVLSKGHERGVPFKHLNIDTEQWYKIVARVHRRNTNVSDSALQLFINCENVGTLDLPSKLSVNIRNLNHSLRFLLGQRGYDKTPSWSKWSGSLRDLRLVFNRNHSWFIRPSQCRQDVKFSQASVTDSVDQCPNGGNPGKTDVLSETVQGLEVVLTELKKEAALLSIDSQAIRRYMVECGYCDGNGHEGAGQSLPTQLPVDYCSTEHSSCDKNADCVLTQGGRAFFCRCKVGYGGNGKYCGIDTDMDGIPNDKLPCQDQVCKKDNCRDIPNTGQENEDKDFAGDICDFDADNDGIINDWDNCPLTANPKQMDSDRDWVGDECDNCPFMSNAKQELICLDDGDHDGVGQNDNCVDVYNPDQKDMDRDQVGDACDNCNLQFNSDQADSDNDLVGDACDTDFDTDGDGVQDDMDNCARVSNPDQLDTDGDKIGDACDDDDDNDRIADSSDNCPLVYNRDQVDTDGDGVGDDCSGDYDGDSIPDTLDACPNNKHINRTDFTRLQTVALDPYGDSQVDPEWRDNQGADIWELKNSDPGLAIGNAYFCGVDFSATLFVNNDDDDDLMGMVFSYQSSSAFYVVTWKKKRQTYWKKTPFTAKAEPGLQLKVVHSKSGPGQTLRNALWHSKSTPNEVEVLWSDPLQTPWQNKTAYRLQVYHRPTEGLIRLRVFSGSRMMVDSDNIVDNTHKGGRLGLFCFSQAQVMWSNIKYSCSENVPESFNFVNRTDV